MAKQYSIADARANLSALVDQAEAGQEVQLTRRGKPVAVVISLRDFARLRGERSLFGVAYQQFLDEHTLEDVGIEKDFFKSTRDSVSGRKVAL